MANNVQNEPGSVRAKRTNIKGAIAGMKVGSQLERTGCLTLGGIGFGWSQRLRLTYPGLRSCTVQRFGGLLSV